MAFSGRLLVALIGITVLASACENKRVGFGLEDSAIRYETKQFADPNILAEVEGQTLTREQILDKSPVIKDLANQERDALAALAYLKLHEKNPQATGTVEVFLPASETPLDQLLMRFNDTVKPSLSLSFKEKTEPNLLAQLGDQKLSYDEISRNHAVLQSIEQRKFRETASQLNSQVSRILLNEVANKKGMTLQDLISKEILASADTKVTDAEISAYAKSIGLAPEELTEELKPKLASGLSAKREQKAIENYVAKNVLKGPIKVAFAAPETSLKLSDEWRPVMGYKDAPVSLVAFSSVTCADCPAFVETVHGLMKKHNGHLKLNWIYNFNENDGVARMVAEAALCADSLKHGKSMDFVREFAQAASQVDEAAFYVWVKKNGLDEAAFRSCFVERKNEALVKQHLEYAKRVGIVANPTLWVNGQTIEGVITPEVAEPVVTDKIEASGSTPFSAFVRRIKSLLGLD